MTSQRLPPVSALSADLAARCIIAACDVTGADPEEVMTVRGLRGSHPALAARAAVMVCLGRGAAGWAHRIGWHRSYVSMSQYEKKGVQDRPSSQAVRRVLRQAGILPWRGEEGVDRVADPATAEPSSKFSGPFDYIKDKDVREGMEEAARANCSSPKAALEDLAEWQCRWPVSIEDDGPVCCGARCAAGATMCEKHRNFAQRAAPGVVGEARRIVDEPNVRGGT